MRTGLIGTAGALSPQPASHAFAAGTTTTNGLGLSPFMTQPFLDACPIMPNKTVFNGLGCETHLASGTMAGPLESARPFEFSRNGVPFAPPYEGAKTSCRLPNANEQRPGSPTR